MAAFFPGLRLAERYLLDKPIAAGGMSQVWRALDEVLGRAVAVKTLAVTTSGAPPHADPTLRAAIRREAQAAASIAHPHVTQVFDFGEEPVPGGGGAVTPYLVMELLEGENLAQRLGASALPWPEAVRVCAEVAGALAAAHRLRVVHRDIKPANVMLTATGAKVVDFGIAALTTGTAAGAVPPRAGTPAYLAPEVLSGEPATTSSDVYGLGALLYAALTGRAPLPVTTWVEAADAHAGGIAPEPLAVPGLPAEVAQLCVRCLSPSAKSRPTAEEVAARLDCLAAPTPPAAPAHPARGIGRATVRSTGPGAVGNTSDGGVAAPAALAGPTMLDAAPTGTRHPVHRAQGARVARRRRSWLAPQAMFAIAVAVCGAVLIVSAYWSNGAGTPATSPTHSSPTDSSPTQSSATAPSTAQPALSGDPETPAATIAAIGTEIATALLGGRIDSDTAQDLAGEVRDLQQRLDANRGGDLLGHVTKLREQLEKAARDGELDPNVASRLDRLLEILAHMSNGD